VPAQIHSDYTFTAIVGVFGPRRLGGLAGDGDLAASPDPPSRPGHARRAALVGAGGQLGNDGQALLSWIAVAWVVLTSCQLAVTVAGNLAVLPLTGVTFPFVSFGRDLAARQHGVPGALPQRRPARAEVRWLNGAWSAARLRDRGEPGRRAGACSASSRWSRSCVRGDPDSFWRQGHSDRYVSVRHVAALQTFERAIVRRTAQEPRLVTTDEVLDGLRRAGANGASRPERSSGCAASPRRRRPTRRRRRRSPPS
jgi:hypothetical protein